MSVFLDRHDRMTAETMAAGWSERREGKGPDGDDRIWSLVASPDGGYFVRWTCGTPPVCRTYHFTSLGRARWSFQALCNGREPAGEEVLP